jgi:hypothetical protein
LSKVVPSAIAYNRLHVHTVAPSPSMTTPDYVRQFTLVLKERGASQAQIDAFAMHWRSLPPNAPKLPCPFCYTAGGWGALSEPAGEEGSQTVRCGKCGETIDIKGIADKRP